jgi:hypothetical protein
MPSYHMTQWVHLKFPWDRKNVGSSRSECSVQVGISFEITGADRPVRSVVVWLLVSSCGAPHHITGFQCLQDAIWL